MIPLDPKTGLTFAMTTVAVTTVAVTTVAVTTGRLTATATG
jgi:hypothetical protein